MHAVFKVMAWAISVALRLFSVLLKIKKYACFFTQAIFLLATPFHDLTLVTEALSKFKPFRPASSVCSLCSWWKCVR